MVIHVVIYSGLINITFTLCIIHVVLDKFYYSGEL